VSTQDSTSNSERDIFCRLTRNRYVGRRGLFAAFEPAESIRRGDAIGSKSLQSQQHTHYVVGSVIESNVHYPTDSSLLGDSIRVLTRSLSKIAKECRQGALEVIGHARAVKYRLLEISRAAKSTTEAGRARLRASYQKLLGLTRGVVRQSQQVLGRLKEGRLPVVGSRLAVFRHMANLEHFLPLAQKVIRQTKERVVLGKEAAEKVLSLFEPHTQVIRKGKATSPTSLADWCDWTKWRTAS